MDEEELLRETNGSPVGGELTKEQEDALLNDEPTTSAAIAMPDATDEVPPSAEEILTEPFQIPAEADETLPADEDDIMMHEDSSSNGTSEGRREALENNDLPASSSAASLSPRTSESSNDFPSLSSVLLNNSFLRSALVAQKDRRAKVDQKREDKVKRQMSRLSGIADMQRRRLAELNKHQATVDQVIKTLQSKYEELAAKAGVVVTPQPFRLPASLPAGVGAATPTGAAAGPTGLGGSNSNPRKRGAGPSPATAMQPPVRRSTGAAAAPFVQVRPPPRRTNGKGRSPPGVQQQQQRHSLQPQRTATLPTPPNLQPAGRGSVQQQQQSRPAVQPAALDPLPRPGPYQQALTVRAQKTPGKNAPGTSQQLHHNNGQRLQQVAQQHGPTPHRVPMNGRNGGGTPNGLVAGGGAAAAPSGAQALQRAALAAGSSSSQRQQQQQQSNSQSPNQMNNRKRPHPQSPAVQLQQAPPLSETQQKIAILEAMVRMTPGSFNPVTIKQLQQVQLQMMHVQRIEGEIQAGPLAQPLPQEPRVVDKDFVVPAVTTDRKITVQVPSQVQLQDPRKRPSDAIPPDTDYMKNDKFAPQIELTSVYEDFSMTAKVSGRIRFVPTKDWPEKTARICLFYYIATQNTGVWAQSTFATVDLVKEGEEFKEATVRFLLGLGKEYFVTAPGQQQQPPRRQVHPMIQKEVIGMVAFACAGDAATGTAVMIRGDEAVCDFGAQRLESEKRKMGRYRENYEVFARNNALIVQQVQALLQRQQQQQRLEDDDDVVICL